MAKPDLILDGTISLDVQRDTHGRREVTIIYSNPGMLTSLIELLQGVQAASLPETIIAITWKELKDDIRISVRYDGRLKS